MFHHICRPVLTGFLTLVILKLISGRGCDHLILHWAVSLPHVTRKSSVQCNLAITKLFISYQLSTVSPLVGNFYLNHLFSLGLPNDFLILLFLLRVFAAVFLKELSLFSNRKIKSLLERQSKCLILSFYLLILKEEFD